MIKTDNMLEFTECYADCNSLNISQISSKRPIPIHMRECGQLIKREKNQMEKSQGKAGICGHKPKDAKHVKETLQNDAAPWAGGITQAIYDRRSIRRYTAEKVPHESIEEVLKAGMRAPSAKNRQPWRFTVATGKAKEEALDAMEKGLEREKENPLLPESTGYLQGAWHSLGIMRQAPVVIFVSNALGKEIGSAMTVDDRVSEICNAQSIGAALENMSLAAREQGLESLWICNTFFAQKEIRDWLGAEGEPYAAMALGYGDENPPARARKEMREVVEWRA